MTSFVKQFYDEAAYVPPEILVQTDLDELAVIAGVAAAQARATRCWSKCRGAATSASDAAWPPRTPPRP